MFEHEQIPSVRTVDSCNVTFTDVGTRSLSGLWIRIWIHIQKKTLDSDKKLWISDPKKAWIQKKTLDSDQKKTLESKS